MSRKQQQRWHDGSGLRSSLANTLLTPCRNTKSRQSGIYDARVLPNPRVFLLTRHTHSQGSSSCYFKNITLPEMTPLLSAPSAHLFGQAAVCWVWIWGAASLKGPLQIGCIYIFTGAVMFSATDAKAASDVSPKQHVMFISMLSFHLARFDLFWYSDLFSYVIPAEVAA